MCIEEKKSCIIEVWMKNENDWLCSIEIGEICVIVGENCLLVGENYLLVGETTTLLLHVLILDSCH